MDGEPTNSLCVGVREGGYERMRRLSVLLLILMTTATDERSLSLGSGTRSQGLGERLSPSLVLDPKKN